ncbi:MAG: HAD-IIA family hydrolase [Acidimicrobiales bacterium]
MLAWAIDLDGVVWRGAEPIPGSADAVARLRALGAPIAFVTNSSARTPAQVAAKLADCGIPDAEPLVVTSAMAAAGLIDPGSRVLVIGGDGARHAAEQRGAVVITSDGLDVESATAVTADAVMVGITPTFDYVALTAAMAAIGADARFVATNDDATFPIHGGRFLPGAGSIVAAVAAATGVAPLVAGKPHEPIAALVVDRLGAEGIAVGDRPETDGLVARALGYRFGLVLSGVATADTLPRDPTPDLVAADLADLVDQVLA